jgi:hypothetical protein
MCTSYPITTPNPTHNIVSYFLHAGTLQIAITTPAISYKLVDDDRATTRFINSQPLDSPLRQFARHLNGWQTKHTENNMGWQ